jgi:hypothetical protein
MKFIVFRVGVDGSPEEEYFTVGDTAQEAFDRHCDELDIYEPEEKAKLRIAEISGVFRFDFPPPKLVKATVKKAGKE